MSIERFLRKQADLSSILPAVAGPALGGYAGRALGSRYGAPDLGAMLGAITGGTTGQLIRERAESSKIPAAAPYALDPTSADIPAWALQGAQLLKQSEHLGDILGGDTLGAGWGVVDGVRNKLPAKQIGKNVAGQTLGTLGGGLAGHAVGGVLNHLAGREIGGVAGIPLSTLLAGLGATIGNVKGLEFANK